MLFRVSFVAVVGVVSVLPQCIMVSAVEHARELQAITYPTKRYDADWASLDADTFANAVALNYNQGRWDLENRSYREGLPYDELIATLTDVEMESLNNLVANEDSWDCWINHYDGYYWEDIELDPSLLNAFTTLGWKQWVWDWDIEANYPESNDKLWVELTDAEKAAAAQLCYDANIWDGIPIHMWTRSDSFADEDAFAFPSDWPSMAPSTTPTEMQKKGGPSNTSTGSKETKDTSETITEEESEENNSSSDTTTGSKGNKDSSETTTEESEENDSTTDTGPGSNKEKSTSSDTTTEESEENDSFTDTGPGSNKDKNSWSTTEEWVESSTTDEDKKKERENRI